jgi:hypothetical protein
MECYLYDYPSEDDGLKAGSKKHYSKCFEMCESLGALLAVFPPVVFA